MRQKEWMAVSLQMDSERASYENMEANYSAGKRILVLQSKIAALNSTHTPQTNADEFGRTPFQHPALASLQKLHAMDPAAAVNKERLGPLAKSYGLDRVTRWKPRYPDRMKTSGQDVVLTQSLLAIVGAIALQKGGEAANHIVREKILKPLGVL